MTNAAKVVIIFAFAAAMTFLFVFLLHDAPFEYLLDCNRFQGSCTFTQRLLVQSKVGWARIDSLERAEVRMAGPQGGAPRIMVWVKSKSSSGDSFFADYESRAEAEDAARRINAFLRDPSDGRLVLSRSVRTTYWIAWGLIPIVAVLVVTLTAVLFRRKKAGPERTEIPQS